MSKQSFAVPAVAVATLLGGGVYMFNKNGRPEASAVPSSSDESKKRQQANAKRDLAGGGVGVGGTAQVMGAEVGAGLNSGNTDNPNRDHPKPNTSRENLPSGGVAGGHGGNNSNTASIEMGSSGSGGKGLLSSIFGKSDATPSPQAPVNSKSGSSSPGSGASSVSEMLQGAAGTGGSTSRDQGNSEDDPKNTKIKSNHGDTPTKKGGSPWDKHRKDVTAVSDTSS
ncbi:hypothetical protein B0T11DRAFT_138537 [Plectosphaerella cucumerina]|uniref:Uncharacterized protein n=1 Tax=Plectosphaerella cucumerina TaxID=40658 RepID=A0A8K0WZ58_9PEZI|nr:hypothetical protein B0T11DRAFT_138537 [Plectosphaerella cucumerina]